MVKLEIYRDVKPESLQDEGIFKDVDNKTSRDQPKDAENVIEGLTNH